MKNRFQFCANDAFTLLELLAVIGIVCILAVLILGLTSHARRNAREGRAKADMELIRNALQETMLGNGSYPESASNSAVMAMLPAGFSFLDPWQKPYNYQRTSGTSYILFSNGQDESAGTADDIGADR